MRKTQPMIASDATALVWITLSSSLLGAMFAYAENRPHGIADFVNTELHGALAGGLNGASSLRSRFWCCGAYGASLHQLPFLPYLARRSLLYLGIILLVLLASNLRVGITRADIAFSLTLSLGYNLLLGVNDLLGPGVLFAFVAGRYYQLLCARWRTNLAARHDILGADVVNSRQKRLAKSCPLRWLLRAFRELSHNLRFAHRKSRGPSRSACQAPHVVRPVFPASSSSVASRTRLATREEKRGSAPLDGRRYIRLKCVELQIELIRDSGQTELPIKTGQGRLAVACFAESSCIGGRVIRHGGVSEETGKTNGRR
jgi:hypothetical protein